MSAQALLVIVVVAVVALVLLRRGSETTVRMPAPISSGGSAIEAALAAGRKIEAIKLYREEHGVGLREAKEAVEDLQRRTPAP